MKLNRIVLPIAVLFSSLLVAQDKTKATEKRDATIQLAYYKKADLTRTAVAIVKAKNSTGKFMAAQNARVNFYTTNEGKTELLNTVTTNGIGKAILILPAELPTDTGHAFTITAKIENDSIYGDADEEMRYKDASLVLKLDAGDTAHKATAILTRKDADGKETPVKGADIKFYVQRLFGTMPAGDDFTVTTDENGKAEFKYPKGIPGDVKSTLSIVAKVDDNDQFGNIETKTDATWGTPLVVDPNPFPRALWEPYAPLPLVITISTLFGGVWLTYFIIFRFLVKIKKAGKAIV